MRILNINEYIVSTILTDFLEQAISEAYSAIAELQDRSLKNIGIFLLGPPASGKSTIINDYIRPIASLDNFAIINPDDISMTRYKHSPEEIKQTAVNYYIPDPKKLHFKKLIQLMTKENKTNFIFDTTGNNVPVTSNLIKQAIENNYYVILVHVLAPLEQAAQAVQNRNLQATQPKVDLDYFYDSHAGATNLIKKYLEVLESLQLDKISYYLVTAVHEKSNPQLKQSWITFFRLSPGTDKVYIRNDRGQYILSDLNIYHLYNKLNKEPTSDLFKYRQTNRF